MSSAFQLPDFWQELRAEVEAHGWLLNTPVFDRLQSVFLQYDSAGSDSPSDLTREFDQKEFLLVMDEWGNTCSGEEMLDEYQKTVAARPEFKRWLRIGISSEGQQVILAARWLCHLVGLRHRTVEIFIDPPHLDGYTLVQIRGLDKFEAPGAFDIPCAGHVSGVDDVEASLRKELGEELNLTFDDLLDFRLLGEYNSYTGSGGRGVLNNEYRFLYRARLQSSAAQQIRFADGEVAGVAVFFVPELRALVDRFPERIASGLGDALIYYL